MGNDRLAKNASIPVLLIAIILAPRTVSAGGPTPQRENGNSPSAGYSAPMASAHSWPGAIVDPTCSACSYTVPILAVYQCPAVLVGQPGSQVRYLRSDPKYGFLGGQPYLYHH
jgi:hypothetical protein